MLLAARFEAPVCPHAGGVGLCETVRHLAPVAPGLGARLHADSVARYRFPDGPAWRKSRAVVA